MLFDLNLSIHMYLSLHATWYSPGHSLGVFDSLGLACSASEAWIEVEPSAEDQFYLSEQAD